MFGKAMIKKVMMYIILGKLALLTGGYSVMDMFLIPMISGIFEPFVKGITGGAENPLAGLLGGTGATS
jgi:hypothetical protein